MYCGNKRGCGGVGSTPPTSKRLENINPLGCFPPQGAKSLGVACHDLPHQKIRGGIDGDKTIKQQSKDYQAADSSR